MKSILDPTFRYTPSHKTDIRKTFDRIRRELQNATTKVPQPADSRQPLDQTRGACAGSSVVL